MSRWKTDRDCQSGGKSGEASFEEGSKCIVVFSSVIFVTHFGNVKLSILRSILVMCSVPSSFQQCPDALDRIRVNLVAESPFVSFEDFMFDIRSQRTVRVETIGDELRFTGTSDVILDEIPDRRSREVGYDFGNDVSAVTENDSQAIAENYRFLSTILRQLSLTSTALDTSNKRVQVFSENGLFALTANV